MKNDSLLSSVNVVLVMAYGSLVSPRHSVIDELFLTPKQTSVQTHDNTDVHETVSDTHDVNKSRYSTAALDQFHYTTRIVYSLYFHLQLVKATEFL